MDQLLKGVVFNNKISLTVIDATQMVNTAIKIHNLSTVAAKCFGKALMAVAFMSATLKSEDDKISITISGDGPSGTIVIAGDANLNIRGYMDNPQCELSTINQEKLTEDACIGRGRMTVLKSMGLKEPYTGSCEITGNDIAEDFARYYSYSEQQPTFMQLSVDIQSNKCISAMGIVFQLMPDTDRDTLQKVLNFIAQNNDTSLINKNGLGDFITQKFPDFLYESFIPKYNCTCSRDYIDGILITLGYSELCETIKQVGKVEIKCHFCNKTYVYTQEDVDKLFLINKGN